MLENQQSDWRAIARARGIPASEAVLRSLDILERDFDPVRAGLSLFDEPALQPRVEDSELSK